MEDHYNETKYLDGVCIQLGYEIHYDKMKWVTIWIALQENYTNSMRLKLSVAPGHIIVTESVFFCMLVGREHKWEAAGALLCYLKTFCWHLVGHEAKRILNQATSFGLTLHGFPCS